MRRVIRGLGLLAVLGLAACGGIVDEGLNPELNAQEQELQQCPPSGICPAGSVCYNGPGGPCYPCRTYPQYCGIDI
jgi:hypothetical protein